MVSLCVLLALHLARMPGCSKPQFILLDKEFSAKGLLLENVAMIKRKLSCECFHLMRAMGKQSSSIREEDPDKKGFISQHLD